MAPTDYTNTHAESPKGATLPQCEGQCLTLCLLGAAPVVGFQLLGYLVTIASLNPAI